jgi:hypothetical protein
MKESTGRNMGALELIKKGADGKTYAIVRENRNYYIKTTDTKDTLTESDFDFIGGVQNKTKNQFRSFEDATSRLNLMFNDINRSYGINESIDMKTFDYVLNENGIYEGFKDSEMKKAVAITDDPKKYGLDPNDPNLIKKARQMAGLDEDKPEEIKPDDEPEDVEGDDEEILMDGEKESIQEKRFVLKQPKKKEEPVADDFDFGGEDTEGGDEFDFGGEDTEGEGGDDFDFGGEDEGGDEFDFGGEGEDTEGEGDEFDFGNEEGGEGEDTEGEEDFDFGDEEGEGDIEMGDEGDPIKDIQRTTGKLGQQLRDTEDLSSDMQKYVVNSVLSALDLSKMDDNDKDSIINKLESAEGSSDEDVDIDFMDDEYQVEYQGGRTFEDDDERAGEPDLDGQEILLDDEGPGGYLGFEDYGEEIEEIPMSQIDMPIRDKGYLNIDPDVASGNVDYMDDEVEVDPKARREAEKDIRSHYNKPSFDEMERGHSLPSDMTFDDEELDMDGPIVYMTDDDLKPCPNDECMDESEMIDYMDDDSDYFEPKRPTHEPAPSKPGNVTRPKRGPWTPPMTKEGMGNFVQGDGETGMEWKTENISYMDDEYTEEYVDTMFGNDDIYGMNSPKTKPSEKPGTDAPTVDPDTKPTRRTRPSTTPFTPPDRDTEPAPAKAAGEEEETTTAPPKTTPKRRTRPSTTPFSPPDRDTEPAPAKATGEDEIGRDNYGPTIGYDDTDVEFS